MQWTETLKSRGKTGAAKKDSTTATVRSEIPTAALIEAAGLVRRNGAQLDHHHFGWGNFGFSGIAGV